ncbi:MAG TPA: ribonuclease H-like domain-containing protein [Anaerolineaceae bacterium]|nr:ribonuclease H-like domain-containing protein [Anaerolineaceae bacterium]HQH85746.1 ribonuclease H-like domain-containing protein [Anaerolineaceae bacterium]
MAESLADKLKALGVQMGAPKIQALPPQKLNVEEILGLEAIRHQDDIAYVFKENYTSSHQHGIINLGSPTILQPEILTQWARTKPINPEGLIFLDTETTGLAGGTGTFAFLVGLGWWSDQGFELQQLFLREPAEEAALLNYLEEQIRRFEGVVTFNGKSFDAPLLNARYTINSLQSPLKGIDHIDLLHLSRRIWRNRLADRSLGNLEEQILRISRSAEEIPGWMVPEIYIEYLRTGDPAPLKGVFYHNAMDILSLAALYVYLVNFLEAPSRMDAPQGLDMMAVARLYEELGYIPQALTLYDTCLSTELPKEFMEQALLRFASIYRRERQWTSAVRLWERAAGELGSIAACVELAKFYEHCDRNKTAALEWTERAEGLLPTLPVQMKDYRVKLINDLQRRRVRLVK